jgi:hypothetical protein
MSLVYEEKKKFCADGLGKKNQTNHLSLEKIP